MSKLICCAVAVATIVFSANAEADDRVSRDIQDLYLRLHEAEQQIVKARRDGIETARENKEIRSELGETKKKMEAMQRTIDDLRGRGVGNGADHGFSMAFLWHYAPVGVLGADLHLQYRPPFWGRRLGLSLTAGYDIIGTGGRSDIVMTETQSAEMNLAFAPQFGADLTFRLVNFDNFNIAVGPTFGFVGKVTKDPFSTSMVGGCAKILIGSLMLEVQKVRNLGKEGNYLMEKDLMFFYLGFEFYPRW